MFHQFRLLQNTRQRARTPSPALVAREHTWAQQLALHNVAMSKESANRKRETRPETAGTQKEGRNTSCSIVIEGELYKSMRAPLFDQSFCVVGII